MVWLACVEGAMKVFGRRERTTTGAYPLPIQEMLYFPMRQKVQQTLNRDNSIRSAGSWSGRSFIDCISLLQKAFFLLLSCNRLIV